MVGKEIWPARVAELKNNLPAVTVDKNGAMIDKVDSAMIDKIDRIDKTEFEKLYAGGGKELLEAAVFEAVLRSFDGNFRASYDLDDPWDRFCTQFCALETFWNEPGKPHKRREAEIYEKQVKIWKMLVLEDNSDDSRSQVDFRERETR